MIRDDAGIDLVLHDLHRARIGRHGRLIEQDALLGDAHREIVDRHIGLRRQPGIGEVGSTCLGGGRIAFDLAAGKAANRWCYRGFGAIVGLAASAAIREAFAGDSALSREAIRELLPGELRAVLRNMTPQDAEALLSRLGEDGAWRVDAALPLLEHFDPIGRDPRQAALQLFFEGLRVGVSFSPGMSLALAEVHRALAESKALATALAEGDELHIDAGRHPVVELSLRDEPFVPKFQGNDLHLVDDSFGQLAESLRGRGHMGEIDTPNPEFGGEGDKELVIEYEADSELRDTEQVPLLEEGGIDSIGGASPGMGRPADRDSHHREAGLFDPIEEPLFQGDTPFALHRRFQRVAQVHSPSQAAVLLESKSVAGDRGPDGWRREGEMSREAGVGKWIEADSGFRCEASR